MFALIMYRTRCKFKIKEYLNKVSIFSLTKINNKWFMVKRQCNLKFRKIINKKYNLISFNEIYW